MKGMSLAAIAGACNGKYHGSDAAKEKIVENITTDSRKVSAGSLFIAIKGERSDGHTYISSVYEKGALCTISEKELPGEEHPYIEVESSLQAIKDIAEYYREQLDIKVVGITGSVGKTSTKETVAAVLSQKYRVLKTAGNFNNELGLPLTIFRLREEDEVAVLEMGISDFGEMTRLTKIAKPDICVITNIGLCHLENLKSRDGILKAKTEIFQSMAKDGAIILNGDDDKLITVKESGGIQSQFFGIENTNGTTYADHIENLGMDGMAAQIHLLNGTSFAVNIPVAGHHMVYNALAATVTGLALGVSSEQIKQGIESLETIAGRNHILKKNGLTVIDDCYNANPVSMKASIDVLSTALKRKVAILGDMFELGENEKELHAGVGTYLAGKDIDLLIAVGTLSENMANAAKEACAINNNKKLKTVYFATRDEMLKKLDELIEENDTILVKASHGMEFPKVVEHLTK